MSSDDSDLYKFSSAAIAATTATPKHRLHYLNGNFFVVVDHRLVEQLKLDERTIFEESLTESGDIVLKRRSRE